VRRGDLVTVALPGAYGKPRPAVVMQSDLFGEHPSVTILPVTNELRDLPLFRVPVSPTLLHGSVLAAGESLLGVTRVRGHRAHGPGVSVSKPLN